jgi:hypothetical protein
MGLKSLGLAAVLVLGSVAAPLEAQQAARAPAPAPAPETSPAIDVSKLPINLSRLHQKLKESTDTTDASKLRFKIDVIGQAPAIQIFRPGENLRFGPTPNSIPTHQEMIEMATPREFRSPVMDFSNLMRWIQSTLKRED